MHRAVAVSIAVSVFVVPAFGQTILGTYTTQNPQGAAITLVIEKTASGVGGSLSGNGVNYTLQGKMQGEDIEGTFRDSSGGGAYFEAHREGAQLRLILVDSGPNGTPDFSKARELVFTARGASAPATSTRPATNSPAVNPLAAAAASASPFAGTFTGADISMTMRKESSGYAGSIKYQGTDYPATAKDSGKTATGSFRAGTQSFEFTLTANDDKHVSLATGGVAHLLARADAPAPANPLAAAATPAANTNALAATPQDQQIASLLLSSAWCSFSYSGGSTFTGGTAGTTRTARTVFRADGTVTQTNNSETTNTGAPGNIYLNNRGGQQGRWKIQNGLFMLSADGIQWASQRLDISRNSNGYPIVKADGVEYMMCN